jgi:hypothetical protein
MYLTRGANHNAGMLADKFGRIGVMWEVDPEILPDARRAGDQSVASADPDPSGGTDLIIGGKGACWAATQRWMVALGRHQSSPAAWRITLEAHEDISCLEQLSTA